jgi:hypothetical protein
MRGRGTIPPHAPQPAPKAMPDPFAAGRAPPPPAQYGGMDPALSQAVAVELPGMSLPSSQERRRVASPAPLAGGVKSPPRAMPDPFAAGRAPSPPAQYGGMDPALSQAVAVELPGMSLPSSQERRRVASPAPLAGGVKSPPRAVAVELPGMSLPSQHSTRQLARHTAATDDSPLKRARPPSLAMAATPP